MENISKVLYPLVNLHIRAWNTTTYFYLYSFDQIFRRLVFVKKETSTQLDKLGLLSDYFPRPRFLKSYISKHYIFHNDSRERDRHNLLYIPPSCVTTSRVLKFLYPSRHGRNQPSMHPRNAGNFIRFPWSADSRIHHALSPRDGGYFHSIFARHPPPLPNLYSSRPF